METQFRSGSIRSFSGFRAFFAMSLARWRGSDAKIDLASARGRRGKARPNSVASARGGPEAEGCSMGKAKRRTRDR